MQASNRVLDERYEADKSSLKLSVEQQARWSACRSTHRFMAFQDKKLVAYSLLFQRPQIIDVFTCKGLDVSLNTGLSSLWESQNTHRQFWVSATPVEVANGCFLWMLKYSSLEFVDYQDSKSLKFSIAYRTVANPTQLVDGKTYLLEKAVFDHFEFPA
jgi:NDP-sugar pyrophosphorylase family protein